MTPEQILEDFRMDFLTIRLQRKLSLREVGRRAGVSYMQVVRFEDGSTSPSALTLLRIARALGVDIQGTVSRA